MRNRQEPTLAAQCYQCYAINANHSREAQGTIGPSSTMSWSGDIDTTRSNWLSIAYCIFRAWRIRDVFIFSPWFWISIMVIGTLAALHCIIHLEASRACLSSWKAFLGLEDTTNCTIDSRYPFCSALVSSFSAAPDPSGYLGVLQLRIRLGRLNSTRDVTVLMA